METITKYSIKELDWPVKVFIGLRKHLHFDELPAFFGNSYGLIYEALGKNGIQSKEAPCAIYYAIDETTNETDVAAAVAVPAETPEIEGFEKISLPPSKVVATLYTGPYEAMMPAYAELDHYLKDHGLSRKLIIEQYLSDPAAEKNQANWKTNIYYIV